MGLGRESEDMAGTRPETHRHSGWQSDRSPGKEIILLVERATTGITLIVGEVSYYIPSVNEYILPS